MFSCKVCLETLSTFNSFFKHMANHHPAHNEYSCPFEKCTRLFNKKSLRNHVNKIHNNSFVVQNSSDIDKM